MLKSSAILLCLLLCIASCKKPKQEVLVPEQEQEQQPEQPEAAAIITPQFYNGGIRTAIKCTDGNIVALISYPAILVKLSATDGSQLWQIDISLTGIGTIYGLAPLPSGGFVVSNNAGVGRIKLVAYDANGNNTWTKTYTDSAYRLSAPTLTAVGRDKIVITTAAQSMAQTYAPAIGMIRVNSNGDEISRAFHPTTMYNTGSTIGLTDKSVLSAYNLISNQVSVQKGCILRKFNDAGNMTDSSFVYETGKEMSLSDIVQMPDGGFICTGSEVPAGGGTRSAFIMRISSDLNVLDKRLITNDTLQVYALSITKAKDGAILVGWGYMTTKNYPIAMKVNNALNVQWQKVYPTINDIKEELYFVSEVNGRYVAAGSSWNGGCTATHFLMDLSESGVAKQ